MINVGLYCDFLGYAMIALQVEGDSIHLISMATGNFLRNRIREDVNCLVSSNETALAVNNNSYLRQSLTGIQFHVIEPDIEGSLLRVANCINTEQLSTAEGFPLDKLRRKMNSFNRQSDPPAEVKALCLALSFPPPPLEPEFVSLLDYDGYREHRKWGRPISVYASYLQSNYE